MFSNNFQKSLFDIIFDFFYLDHLCVTVIHVLFYVRNMSYSVFSWLKFIVAKFGSAYIVGLLLRQNRMGRGEL